MDRYVVAALRGLLIAIALGCALLLMRAACDEPVSAAGEDVFVRHARAALAGEFGILQSWQADAYRYGLAKGLTVPSGNRSKATSYGPFEPCGSETFSGEPVSTRWVSVDPRVVPLGALVWTPWGLRYAMDTGGAVKVADRYLRDGENQNLDYYMMRDMGRVTLPWVIVKTKTIWNWYGLRKWRDWSKQGPCPAKYLPVATAPARGGE